VFCISRCSERRRGTATATFNGANDLGLALGSAVSGLLIPALGYTYVYLQGAAVCEPALVIYLLTLSNGRRGAREGA
jgi:predicted MFS family arabinose efflux permease